MQKHKHSLNNCHMCGILQCYAKLLYLKYLQVLIEKIYIQNKITHEKHILCPDMGITKHYR